ncbi:radical SAM protein [Candidatus Atribacteria bacterium HGW-Atribacteria-1]|nr:MAG: radical SAM protein [Candidatus Atribacteria bacterium HGW-Atribacteria-1]
MSARGFLFQTEQGNSYFYDDTTGAVRHADDEKSIKKLLNESGDINNYPTINTKPSKEEIKEHLENYGYKQLILIITENCNLRCKYCVYSENYTNTRVLRNVNMDFETAKKAIEKYFFSFFRVKSKNPVLIPTIGFYGGEPLLNFELIKKVVDYFTKTYDQKIYFGLTTNATLLNDEMINFFVKYNFGIAISLNGHKEEHDRLRVYANGTGSFDRVMRNIKRIKKRYPEYFKLYCTILISYDTGTDLLKVRNFYIANEENLPKIGRITSIATSFTNWYNQYSHQEKEGFKKSLDECKKIYFHQLKEGTTDPFLQSLIGSSYFLILNRAINVPLANIRPPYIPYTGACTPGDKITVDPKGNLHCCEKINDKFPIGNVKNWLDFNKIIAHIDRYNKDITPDCWKCPITRLCPLCYIQSGGNGRFEKSQLNCDNIISNIKTQFKEIWSLLEGGVPIRRIFQRDSEYF